MSQQFCITRQIGIDAGHRIPNHSSKCRSPHGHRYEIYAEVVGDVALAGSEEGMAGGLDFGFLKEEMLNEIDEPADHAMIISWQDRDLLYCYCPKHLTLNGWNDVVASAVNSRGFFSGLGACDWKLYVIPTVPTAENLARHWYERLSLRITARSNGLANLRRVIVWETPNCKAEFPY